MAGTLCRCMDLHFLPMISYCTCLSIVLDYLLSGSGLRISIDVPWDDRKIPTIATSADLAHAARPNAIRPNADHVLVILHGWC